MLFSIIIPAYNAHSTIERCLNSIYQLPISETEYEVIVIDDCSTDDTTDVVKKYAIHHPNITLLVQPENHRAGAARNLGVSIARGKYVVFLDSGDELESGVLAAILLADKSCLEMVAMRGLREGFGGKQGLYNLHYSSERTFSGIDLQTEHPYWCSGPCLYVYLKSFLDLVGYPFTEDVLYEDSDFVSVHLYHAKRMGYSDECGYIIHENSLSITHTMSHKHVCDYALLGTRMLAFYHKIQNKNTLYARTILEGGSFNIMKASHLLFRLKSVADVRAVYDRFDDYADRKLYLGYKYPAYCWTKWTRFCLKHRKLTIGLIAVANFFHFREGLKLFIKWKRVIMEQ